jgi:hypothetical protein
LTINLKVQAFPAANTALQTQKNSLAVQRIAHVKCFGVGAFEKIGVNHGLFNSLKAILQGIKHRIELGKQG